MIADILEKIYYPEYVQTVPAKKKYAERMDSMTRVGYIPKALAEQIISRGIDLASYSRLTNLMNGKPELREEKTRVLIKGIKFSRGRIDILWDKVRKFLGKG